MCRVIFLLLQNEILNLFQSFLHIVLEAVLDLLNVFPISVLSLNGRLHYIVDEFLALGFQIVPVELVRHDHQVLSIIVSFASFGGLASGRRLEATSGRLEATSGLLVHELGFRAGG